MPDCRRWHRDASGPAMAWPVRSRLRPRSAAGLRPQPATRPDRGRPDRRLRRRPTTRAPVPPNTVACSQTDQAWRADGRTGVGPAGAQDHRRAFPTAGRCRAGTGDVGGRMEGPGGMSATVTIAQTQLDPAAAFTEYADDAMAVSPVSSVSVLPGQLCGYSGQKLMGAWSDTPQTRRRIRRPHRPHLDQQRQQLSRRRARAGARREHDGFDAAAQRC